MKPPTSLASILALACAAFSTVAALVEAPSGATPANASGASQQPVAAEPAPLPADPRLEKLLDELNAQQQSSRTLIEELRAQATDARRARDIADARLKLIEHSLAEQRDAELDALRSSNRLNLALGIAFLLAGLAGAAVIGFILFRAVQRMGELTGQLLLAAHRDGQTRPPSARVEAADPRLAELMSRIEDRMRALESTAVGNVIALPQAPDDARSSDRPKLVKLMQQGVDLLTRDCLPEALECFESVLRLDSAHVEALVKSAKTLEKLGRLEEAVESYDRALSLDGNLTVAYLGKGSALNKLQRFEESLECYERALGTREGRLEPGPMIVRE